MQRPGQRQATCASVEVLIPDSMPNSEPSLRSRLRPSLGLRSKKGYRVLSEREIRIIEAVSETLFPSQQADVTIDDVGVVEYFDDLFATVPLRERVLLRCLLALFDLQHIVIYPRRPRRFVRATVEERTQSLQSWEQSDIYFRRMAFQAIRSLVLWAYVDSPIVAEAMGVEAGTDIIERRRKARAGTLYAAEEALRSFAGSDTELHATAEFS